MRSWLIFTLLSFITGNVTSLVVTGYTGGTIITYCHYSKEERNYNKYFCLGQYRVGCQDKIRTGDKNTLQHNDRFSLYENSEENYFMVVIRQLTRQDEGMYQCGVDIPFVGDSYIKVELKVKDEECCKKSVTQTGYLGRDVNIICNYPEDYKNSIKYFCKERSDFKTCSFLISAHHDSATRAAGKFSLTDNRTERRYTVTISNLTEDDAGTYWCGLETRTEARYIALITAIKLCVITSQPSTRPTTPNPKTYNILESSSSSTSIQTPLRRSGILVAIIVSVILAVVVVIIVIMAYKRRCSKVDGLMSSSREMSRSVELT
ncbi:hypothetical protein UPYG_G00059060 [Umbra pygmaea]|uniref:Immunoglobulin domain-containing protein n=1 Tax=Umbra pygmaea TaxID=75934 RepID=A0ABD0X8W8_UMBPY